MKNQHLLILGLVLYFLYQKNKTSPYLNLPVIGNPNTTGPSSCPYGFHLWINYDPATDTFINTCEPA